MRVVLSTPGVFHHYALARELDARGSLTRAYTTFPWARIKREGIARSIVRTFPYVHPAALAIRRKIDCSPAVAQALDSLSRSTFDRYVARSLPACDFLIALSGYGLRSGRRAQQTGATYICDRGSSHMRYQSNILAEEYARWGCTPEPPETATIAIEEAEYEAADYILVPSEFSRRSFIEMGVPREKLRKAVLAADVARFYPDGKPNPEEFCVLFVGHISFRKGVPYLLEAFARLKHPRKRLRLIGNVEDRMRAHLAGIDLTGVEFEGNQPYQKVRQAMSEAHVTVLASIEDGFGMVLAEAMACGSPVITSVNTGGPDLFDDGREGFVVPIRDPGAIHAAFRELADDPGRQQAMSAAALARMQQLGGWAQYGDTVTATLREIMDLRVGTAGRAFASTFGAKETASAELQIR